MKYKVLVNTPKNQAAKCVNTQREQLLGWNLSKQIVESVVINDRQFYWLIEMDPKDYSKLISNCAKGEVLIKKFYHSLIKLIDRANKLSKKFKKGSKWIREYLVKMSKKHFKHNDSFIREIESMTDEEIKGWLEIEDRKEIMELLSNELITISIPENELYV